MTTKRGPGEYDLVLLGGGSAGIVAGVMAGGLGLRVLLIEKYRMGGECLNTGCVPSKALIHAARVAWALRADAAAIGLPVCAVRREEAAAALAWARAAVPAVRDADATEQLLREHGVEIRIGDARFRDAHTLLLRADGGEQTITAGHFLIATGSRPAVPAEIDGLSETPYLTNQTVFDLDVVPERLLVIGGGPVGVEMAQAFQRLGSRVTLVQRGETLLPRDDGELVRLLADRLRAEGVDLRMNTRAERIENGRTAIVRAADGTAETVPFDRLLLATGREPNVEDLSLAAAGVTVAKGGIVVDDRLRTTAPNIYACGDVIAGSGDRFSHVAEYQAKIAVRNIVFPGSSRATLRDAPWTTFTDPELAHIGLTEDAARTRGMAFDVYRQPFAQNDRAITDGDGARPGLVKVLVEPGLRGRILGVQILGPQAGELIQEWILAMEQDLSIRAIADMVHVYPTLSMASQHVAQRWYERQSRTPFIHAALDTYIGTIRPHEKAIAAGAALGIGAAALLAASRRRGRR